MKYFLVQDNNRLVHLPDCRFEEGQRETVEVSTLQGPAFIKGRKQPDIFIFSVPPGASVTPCLIVDENALVRRVLVSRTEIGAHTYMAAGVVEDTFEAPQIDEAREAIAAAMRALEEE